jgi:hypothetical protein
MSTRFLPLREGDTAHWALLTCPYHRAGEVALKRDGAFTEVRCRECAREAEPVPAHGSAVPPGRVRPMGGAGWTTGV